MDRQTVKVSYNANQVVIKFWKGKKENNKNIIKLESNER